MKYTKKRFLVNSEHLFTSAPIIRTVDNAMSYLPGKWMNLAKILTIMKE
jgi:hypothetical protein